MAETPMDRMEAELWAGPMGERWLTYRDQFESMIAQPGEALIAAAGFKDVRLDPWQGEQFIGGQGADAKTATRFVLEGLAFADSLKELPEATRKQAEAELADLMARHEGPGGVSMGSMVWLVSATA